MATAVVSFILYPGARSIAASPSSVSTARLIAAQLQVHPGGTVVGNEVRYGDGLVFVAVPDGTLSLSQCASTEFCVWDLPSYNGSFSYMKGQDVTRTMTGAVGSIYNNRAHAARLYTNTGAGSTCYAARAKVASVSSSYDFASQVYLSATTSC